jgi:alcohol dehydrogenase class IV
VVDPELLQGAPPKVIAACAVDALGHAIEAAMSRAANPISRLMAREAVGLICRNLPMAVAAPEAAEPREALALAATLAGCALSISGVTMAHSVAHALGAVLNMPHSEAVALATPLGLRYNAEACGELFAELAASCRLEGDFVEGVTSLIASLGLPQHIAAQGHNPADLAARLAKCAFATTPQPLRLNPRKIDEATLTSLLAALIKK